MNGQVLERNPDVKAATFADVSEKFIRNMKMLQTMVEDTEIQKRMTALIGQSSDLLTLYRSKNSGNRREEILKQMDEMTKRGGLRDSDQKRLQKLQDELKNMDPESGFGKGREQVQKTANELRQTLGQVYETDSRQKDVMRLIQQHVNYYTSALGKMDR